LGSFEECFERRRRIRDVGWGKLMEGVGNRNNVFESETKPGRWVIYV
jgi:hypothetical protein